MIINGKKIKAKEIMEMTGRSEAYELRSQGLKWQQVADKMGCSYHGAVALYRRYVALDMPQNSL
ncbi:hypothetical protein K4G94_20410 [Mycobacterium tuberculosis]|uniref:hypothetical protein n=1 Tax=Mycobacterium tuberculosis TaxID=1773 RepID=UPI001C7D549B|nr:hypothetical protein [Mycobacterium tuberculosis]